MLSASIFLACITCALSVKGACHTNQRTSIMRATFSRFVRSYTTMDLRTDEETRKVRAERYARKNKTCGKRAVFN
ncbi:hypothetical protein CPT_Ptah_001 [Stenotrophomonas phage Ptah]|uniref:Uncharacterized protein n=1 Tax=Stenotrophomonas phage Ptah TaxID=2859657 RepID=A0AAE7WLJ3_9CAUD|nr:hypothetical protein CPT_Ptah_001 [Stenotrophomonas phage Ptah]